MNAAIVSRATQVHADASQGQGLRVVPILGPSHEAPEYKLLDQQTLPLVQVTEVSDAGHVPELLVTNGLEVMVFLMDGQELIGAKQNRILNTDVLVPARSSLKIPVSCVERGRWHSVAPAFVPGKTASHRTRSAKPRRVHQSLKERGSYDADQAEVWGEVEQSLVDSSADSATRALADAYSKRSEDLARFRGTLRLPDDAVGVAVFHGSSFQGLDLFDRHSTLRYFWESLVDSYAIDWLGSPIDPHQETTSPEGTIVRQLLTRAAGSSWERFVPPGAGSDWRIQDEELVGSALVWDDSVVVHLQLFPGRSQPQAGSHLRPRIHRRWRPASQ